MTQYISGIPEDKEHIQITPMFSIRFQPMPGSYHSSSCMAAANPVKHGKVRRMDVKDSRLFFLRKGYSVYLVDQPRRGRAGASSLSGEFNFPHTEIMLVSLFRIGQWPELFPGVQFPDNEESLHQIFRQATHYPT